MKMDNSYELRSELFRRLLNVLWLRPERALHDAHDLFTVYNLLGENFQQPSLEYGCTEGCNTFIMLGGEFDHEHDDYSEVLWAKDSHTKSSMQDDYFNTFKESYVPKIKTQPEQKISVGLSWHEAHIKKSNRLGVFEKTERIELNSPLNQFEDNSFATIWSPNIFWSDDNALRMLLNEHRRILKDDGRIITIFPDHKQKNHALLRYINQVPKRYHQWLQDLDRGKYVNLTRHAYSYEKWDRIFSECGLTITNHRHFLPSIVGEVYEIGFRPMFPVFMNIYEKLKNSSSSDFLDVKKHWIDTCYHFFSPMCDTKWMDKMGMENLWHTFELKKK